MTNEDIVKRVITVDNNETSFKIATESNSRLAVGTQVGDKFYLPKGMLYLTVKNGERESRIRFITAKVTQVANKLVYAGHELYQGTLARRDAARKMAFNNEIVKALSSGIKTFAEVGEGKMVEVVGQQDITVQKFDEFGERVKDANGNYETTAGVAFNCEFKPLPSGFDVAKADQAVEDFITGKLDA